jgi:outer membrane protein assembly factor BamB
MTNKIEDLVFVGFNKQIIALDRYSGEKVWDWKASKGTGFPAMLLDGDRIIVSVQGYTYCLEPTTGSEVWFNELKGYGTGIANIISINGSSSKDSSAQAITAQAAAAASTSTAGVTT